MAQRLVPYKVQGNTGIAVNQEMMRKNMMLDANPVPSKTPQSGFIFRGLNDKDVFYDQTQTRNIEMYRTLYVWLAGSYTEDSTKFVYAKQVLDKMEQQFPRNARPMDYRQKYQIAMLYSNIGDKNKFEEYAKEAYDKAYPERTKYSNNLQSYYNPYRILLDIAEARGDYKGALDLLKELNQNDPSVKQKMDAIMMRMGQK